jgi:hypothetical protein
MDSMTDEQKFLFDLQGYLVLERMLPPEQVARMLAEVHARVAAAPDNDPFSSRFGGFLEWGEDWRGLIDHERLLPVVRALCGEKFRLDHAYGMAMRADGRRGAEDLHHHAAIFDHGCYYTTHGERMHNGLIVVGIALTDVPSGAGGFCCIPGTHKSLFPPPKGYWSAVDNPLVKHVPMRAGDAVVFTEALTHGTQPWTCTDHERRAVLLKYAPGYYAFSKQAIGIRDPSPFTPRQLRILAPAGNLMTREQVVSGTR